MDEETAGVIARGAPADLHRAIPVDEKQGGSMIFARAAKQLIRRLGITLFWVLEVLGLPPVPEDPKREGGNGHD